MIVDLMRNDLSRVCAAGQRAGAGAAARRGPSRRVASGIGRSRQVAGRDAGRAADHRGIPAGSVTGAPKVRALEIIHELEATPREVYTGAVGYRSPVAGLELNVAIRTFEFGGDRVWLGSGGGIVAGSSDADEYRECLLKAAPLIRGAERHAPRENLLQRPAGDRASRPRCGHGPRWGVYVAARHGGRGHDLDGHIARLDESTWQLFGKRLQPGLRDDLATDSPGSRPGGCG